MLLFSDPRGGSTWLAEVLNAATNAPIIWEPLHLKMEAFKKLNFGWRQYIPEDADWPEARHTFEALFCGHLLNEWLASATSTAALKGADRLLFKFCRGSMLLPYLTRQFNFLHRPVFLVRHPFAVVASQMKHGAWEKGPTSFHIPEIPFNDVFVNHRDFLSTLNTVEEVLAATWCFHNGYTLKHQRNNRDWITVTYESMLLEPEKIIRRILDNWDIDIDVSELELRRKSTTTRSDSPDDIRSQLSHWKNSLDEDTRKRILRVMEYFEIRLYDGTEMPNTEFH